MHQHEAIISGALSCVCLAATFAAQLEREFHKQYSVIEIGHDAAEAIRLASAIRVAKSQKLPHGRERKALKLLLQRYGATPVYRDDLRRPVANAKMQSGLFVLS